MRSVEEHQRIVTELITARPAVSVELRAAEGRVLAEDVIAAVSLPVFDNSAMDGYAVRAVDTRNASPENPVQLPVVVDQQPRAVDLQHVGQQQLSIQTRRVTTGRGGSPVPMPGPDKGISAYARQPDCQYICPCETR